MYYCRLAIVYTSEEMVSLQILAKSHAHTNLVQRYGGNLHSDQVSMDGGM